MLIESMISLNSINSPLMFKNFMGYFRKLLTEKVLKKQKRPENGPQHIYQNIITTIICFSYHNYVN